MRSLQERREYFNELNRKRFSPEEVLRLVPDDELISYVRRGSRLAIKEFKRRNAIAGLKTTIDDHPLDIGV